jgi:hypothetical protein
MCIGDVGPGNHDACRRAAAHQDADDFVPANLKTKRGGGSRATRDVGDDASGLARSMPAEEILALFD